MISVTIDVSKATKEEYEAYLASDLRKVLLSHFPVPIPKNWNGKQFLVITGSNPTFDTEKNQFIFNENEAEK